MDNKKIITLVNGIEKAIEVELLCAFEIPNTKQKYIVYTKNEKDKERNIIIYIGKLETSNNKQFLINIETENEWNNLKDIIKKMTNYDNPFKGVTNERN